ncbi:MAG: hypothetical protein M1817_006483 [Caeruleum heppii]|nr:MAG: hypothetical protein M1817_006483 [Caeruleum heppii]
MNGFQMDPALQASIGNAVPYPPAPSLADPHHSLHSHNSMDFAGFDTTDASLLDTVAHGETYGTPEPGAEIDGSSHPKARDRRSGSMGKRTSGTSAQNDIELRRLFREHERRSLQDMAAQLQGNERGPQSERIRQIFAMLWLNTACKKSSSSVPRGRVYGHYVSRCGTERVTVLNPASFGKLVRVMFPGIQTRRLGMRGESKYHYCGLSLQEDQPDLAAADGQPNDQRLSALQGHPLALDGQSTSPTDSQLPKDTAVFPSPRTTFKTHHLALDTRTSRVSSSLFYDAESVRLDGQIPSSGMIERDLHFPRTPEAIFRENEPIDLPNISNYAPPGTDQDTAAALTALYRSNCTSLIDCVRFCRVKPFFHFFTSFHGTLTVPVQKLLANPGLAPWIKECDWLMYQKMIRVVAPLTLQVVPKQVLEFLKTISQRLCGHIRSSFHAQPPHVVEAKLGPATIFASLLDRLLRVNLAAHAAANILCNNANRDQMYEEWIAHVEAIKIVQNELPNCGYSEVLHILTSEIRTLLEPLSGSWEIYGVTGGYEQTHSGAGASTEGVLDRWTNFLVALPDRFPQADARVLIACLNSVATAALRDITMNGGKSFGSWWITKLWLDEMIAWMAEKGGFMRHSPLTEAEETTKDSTTGRPSTQEALSHASRSRSGASSLHDSRFSSVDNDSEQPVRHDRHGSKMPFDLDDRQDLQNHNDSGIGMRMGDEDLSLGGEEVVVC